LSDLSDFHGCGQSAGRLQERLAALVAAHGPGALCLDDKPELRDKILAFARGN
jgi:hypothetical protein